MSTLEHLISGNDFILRSMANGKDSLILEVAGRPRLSCGRVRCAEFSEQNGISQKFRVHRSADNLTASFETASIIPFGCEYKVERNLEAANGFATLTLDISAVNYGRVGNVALEDLVFNGPWVKLEFLIFGEEKFRTFAPTSSEQIFYQSHETPVMIRLTAEDGVKVEFAIGSNLWEHRAGLRISGATSKFVLSGNQDKILFQRQILNFEAETEVEKRPWRFRSVLAWSAPKKESAPLPEAQTIDFAAAPIAESGCKVKSDGTILPQFCLASAPARKFIREQVRLAASSIRIDHANFGICMSAAHLKRANKKMLEHFDLEEWIAFYIWGNRQLLKNGYNLTMHCASGLFSDSVSAANLARCLCQLEERE